MRMRTELCFLAAALRLDWASPNAGSDFLIGTPAADHWQHDDRYMGAGLAPYAYCLAPGVVLVLLGSSFYIKDRKAMKNSLLTSAKAL